ncbi:MAG: lipopolysaccharide kinase [Deltaproteobacteria bacterium]|nr:lipopolysaccharide kinase [Deltaproteobacteria bacterium]
MENHFFSDADQKLLQANDLGDFDRLWELEIDWFEPPNFRRSGWSGAARHELTGADGRPVGIFIKRQENHLRRTWRYPRCCPTFRIEWQNLKRLAHHRVGVPRPLYYGERLRDGKPQAILITYELKDFVPLDNWLAQLPEGNRQASSRTDILAPVATTIRHFHDQGFRHNCLYPKHIMLRPRHDGERTTAEVRLIDLEKSRRVISKLGARIRDLATLMRRCPQWSPYERNLLLNYYLGAGLEHLPPHQLAEQLWRYPLVKWVKRRVAANLKKK